MIKELALISIAVAIPTATRPTPNTIIVQGADWAGVMHDTETWHASNRVLSEYAFANEGSIEYTVDPFKDYTIQAYTRTIVEWPDESEPIEERTELFMPSTDADKLDWLMFERIRWELRFNEFMEQNDLNNFDVASSRLRVLGWYQTEMEGTE